MAGRPLIDQIQEKYRFYFLGIGGAFGTYVLWRIFRD